MDIKISPETSELLDNFGRLFSTLKKGYTPETSVILNLNI